MERPEKLGPLRLHFSETVNAPREDVFAFFADHERFGSIFAPGGLVKRTRAAEGDDPNGVGSVRAGKLGPITLLEEVIVAFEPCELIEYTATKGPIRDHLGRIEFSDDGQGRTRIEYRIWLDGKLPGIASLLSKQLGAAWKRGWKRTAGKLEAQTA